METVRLSSETRSRVRMAKMKGLKVGFVPTMGYLHEGHLSLVRSARQDTGMVVVSIYVNPTQFCPGEDLQKYPRDLERDQKVLAQEGVDVLFAPSDSEMYPGTSLTSVRVSGMTTGLCGAHRPGHFDGVCTVVTKLFNIVEPDVAYFGQKDYQQAAVIRKMVHDLNSPVLIKTISTSREEDGLARSSRNVFLSPVQRQAAQCLWQGLTVGKDCVFSGVGDVLSIERAVRDVIEREKEVTSIDYVALVHPETLEPISSVSLPLVIAVAIRMGGTRLIDNLLVEGI